MPALNAQSAILDICREFSESRPNRKVVPSTPRLSFWTVLFRHNPGEDVFFRAAAILKSEKTLGTRLGSGQDALSLFQRHNLVPRIVTFLGTGNLSDSIMCQMTVSTLSRFFYLSFFAGAWRKTACVIIIGNAATRCFAATTLELASAYH